MPQLPPEIWRRRLESELEEMKATDYNFTVTKDLQEYAIELNARGLAEESGRIVSKDGHKVRIVLKRDFPYPGGIEVAFTTPIFHPNVRREDGLVCIQLLNEWSETSSVSSVVNGLKWLLENPNPASPLNKDAAEYFVKMNSAAGSRTIKKPRIV
jgi:ubiquitin-protein ligase